MKAINASSRPVPTLRAYMTYKAVTTTQPSHVKLILVYLYPVFAISFYYPIDSTSLLLHGEISLH